jgi:hypothetical protein
MRQWPTRKKCKFVYLNIFIIYKLDSNLLTIEPRAVDPHCFDADPDPAKNLDADPDPDPGGGGGRSAKCASPLAKS